jgi:hypothetical protein
MEIIITVIAAVVAGVVGWAVKKFVGVRLSAAQSTAITAFVKDAVKAAEQIFKGASTGKEKRAYVVDRVCEAFGLNNTDSTSAAATKLATEINVALEAAVWELNATKADSGK